MPDEELNFDPGDAGQQIQLDEPTYRATIRKGRVMLTGWAGWLAAGGMCNGLLRNDQPRCCPPNQKRLRRPNSV